MAVPEAVGVKIVDSKDCDMKGLPGAAEVFFDDAPAGLGRRFFLTGSTSSESVCPYWCIEETTEAREINMMPVLYKVQLVGGSDVVSETPKDLSSTRLALASGAFAKAGFPTRATSGTPASCVVRAMASRGSVDAAMLERFVYIPVLVNSVTVLAGRALKIEKNKKVAPPKPAVPIAISQLAKRAKLL